MTIRSFGETAAGQQFSAYLVEAVWRKATVVSGIDPAIRRKDACGAWIDRDQYGIADENGTGWEIDHIFAVARGGGDSLGNLQPLQWQNNRAKGDHVPGQWVRAVGAPAAPPRGGSRITWHAALTLSLPAEQLAMPLSKPEFEFLRGQRPGIVEALTEIAAGSA